MDKTLISVGIATLVGYIVFAVIRPSVAVGGLETTFDMLLQATPWIVVSMFSAGLIAQFVRPDAIASLFGPKAGALGVIFAATLGLVGTGSRWAVYPLAAGLLATDATPGAVFAFLTSWQLVSLPRLPAEIPFLGVRYTILRSAVSFALAVVGGLAWNAVDHWTKPN